MPLFSSSKRRGGDDDDDDALHDGRPADGAEPQQPPDEHTRLLPDQGRAMLRPDDPQVTPYNLWSIRILRYLTLVFSALALAWWVLLLVSAFATPPGLHTRGGSFYAFAYASLALANLLFSLVFFDVPAKPVRVLAVVTAVSFNQTPPPPSPAANPREPVPSTHTASSSSSCSTPSCSSVYGSRATRRAGSASSALSGPCS